MKKTHIFKNDRILIIGLALYTLGTYVANLTILRAYGILALSSDIIWQNGQFIISNQYYTITDVFDTILASEGGTLFVAAATTIILLVGIIITIIGVVKHYKR